MMQSKYHSQSYDAKQIPQPVTMTYHPMTYDPKQTPQIGGDLIITLAHDM